MSARFVRSRRASRVPRNHRLALPPLSLLAQPDFTLVPLQIHADEGFDEGDKGALSRPNEDLAFFKTDTPTSNTANFFPDFYQLRGQFETLDATTTLDECMAHDYDTQIPSPTSKPPIKFRDFIGRKFSFPWRLCKTWEVCINFLLWQIVH